MKFWIKLDEGDSKWVQLLSPGNFKHRIHGEIELTQDRFQKFVDNFKAQVRGTDLDIDYDHKMDPAKGKKAAGWIKDLQAKAEGLFALVDWTDEAKQAIKNKEYRYLSADFYDKWTNEEGKEYNDVLAGAGLTNRPFLKNMLPVNLTELMESEESMDPELKKKLIAHYKLSETATDDEVTEAVKKAENPATTATVDTSKAEVKWSDDKKTATITVPGVDGEITVSAPDPVKASEDDNSAELKKLAEDNPALAKLLADREEDQKRLGRLENANRLSEVSHQLGEIDGLPPVVLTELRESLVSAPKNFSDKVIGAIKTLRDGGFVPSKQLSGGGGPGAEDNAGGSPNAIKKFLEEVDKVREKDTKLSEADAYDKVATENPQLYYDYDNAVREGKTQFQEG